VPSRPFAIVTPKAPPRHRRGGSAGSSRSPSVLREAVTVPLRVAHSLDSWLPIGSSWLYNQVAGAFDQVEPHIVCDVSKNLDRFPVPHLYAASDRRLAFHVDRVLRKASARRHRSLLAVVITTNAVRVLHSHFGQTGWQNARFARRRDIPHVVSCYGEDMTKVPACSRRWRGRYTEMLASIDVILCEGPYMAATVERLGSPPEKIRTHTLGVDLTRIPFRPREVRPERVVRILMASAFREKKGLPYAVRALGLLAQRGVRFEATLVGDARPGDDPGEKREILGALEHFGIQDRVSLPGTIPHDRLLELAYQHDIFLSPSVTAADGDAEGGAPVSLIEMAASGMPIVSTTHCDIPFVLGEPNRGLLVAERDTQGLVDALENLLEMDWGPLITANRARIEERHDARKQALELVRLYRELAA
jgi:colanic acid/amylovoran biosynthesis glycosyltransferase